jgi:hypothetical protein
MVVSWPKMRSSFASSFTSKATGSKGVPYMVVDALVEVSDTKLIRRRRGDRRGEWSRLD